ncbi:MAG TPA: hypothetical protein VJN89_16945 [Candidatus Acidoferrum sp.]|nr:hypothetical protein [Candidatus Acidoferrum sp.]
MAQVKQAAVGFRVHSGWAAMVAVALEKSGPVVLCRERPHLVKIFNYSYRQPYHTAEKMPLGEARAFISQVRAEARGLARSAMQRMQARVREAGYDLSHCGALAASGRALPKLEEILAAHPLIHTADGELFREALLHASERSGLKTQRIKEKELLETAKKTLHEEPAALLRRTTEMGKAFGSPWSQDEKFATLAAWLALTSHNRTGLQGSQKSEERKKPNTESTEAEAQRSLRRAVLSSGRARSRGDVKRLV